MIWTVGQRTIRKRSGPGRLDSIRTLRTGGGLSGFTKSTEKSDYDPFGAAPPRTHDSPRPGKAV